MALLFDGTADYIDLTDAGSFAGTAGKAALSGSAWVKIDASATGTSMVFDFTIAGSTASRFQWQLQQSGALNFYHRIGGRANDGESFQFLVGDPQGLFLKGEWHHVGAVLDYANDEIHAYLDGVLVHSDLAAGWVGTASGAGASTTAVIGRDSSPGQFMDGTMEDVRLYGRVLTASEFQTIYASRGHDGIVDGLEGRWFMNEKAPGELADNPTSTIGIGVSASATGTSTTLNIGAAGNDRLVVVIAGDESSGTNLTGVTVDGKACTNVQVSNNSNGLGNHQEMWAIQESALGASSGSVTVAISGGDGGWAVAAQVFTNVAAGGHTDSNINNTVVTGPTIPVPTGGAATDVVAGGLVVAGYGQGSGGQTAIYTSPLVERENPKPSSAELYFASALEVSAQSSKTYTATMSSTFNRGTGIVATWNPVSAGPPTVIVDYSNQGKNGVPISDPVYAESQLSIRKRYK